MHHGRTTVGSVFDIYMTKLEKEAILPPTKPKSYKRFVDNILTRRKTHVPDQLLEFLNNYHPNIKLTYESNHEKFLDTKICFSNNPITIKVHQGVTKLNTTLVFKYYEEIQAKCNSRRFV